MTTATNPTPTGKIVCLDCRKPLTRWDSRHRRRGQVCQDKAEQAVLNQLRQRRDHGEHRQEPQP
jgi:hypothetical protein